MTDWKYMLTITVSDSNRDVANHLAAAIGSSVAELRTFIGCNYEKPDQSPFCLRQSPLKEVAVSKIQGPLTEEDRPDWDKNNEVDMVKAEQGRLMIVWDDFTDIDNKIVCVKSDNPDAENTIQASAIKAGLIVIPPEI